MVWNEEFGLDEALGSLFSYTTVTFTSCKEDLLRRRLAADSAFDALERQEAAKKVTAHQLQPKGKGKAAAKTTSAPAKPTSGPSTDVTTASLPQHQSLTGHAAAESIGMSRYELRCLLRKSEKGDALQSYLTGISLVT